MNDDNELTEIHVSTLRPVPVVLTIAVLLGVGLYTYVKYMWLFSLPWVLLTVLFGAYVWDNWHTVTLLRKASDTQQILLVNFMLFRDITLYLSKEVSGVDHDNMTTVRDALSESRTMASSAREALKALGIAIKPIRNKRVIDDLDTLMTRHKDK